MTVSILFADVVGYSALMEQLEQETHIYTSAAIREFHELSHSYGGKIRQVQGDGLALEFHEAHTCLRFAIAIQQKLAQENLTLSNGERILFRIGIHTGPIMAVPDGLRGHTVNVAARVEGCAEPGGICITHETFSTIPERFLHEFRIEDMGYQNLKNVLTPMRLYNIATGVSISPSSSSNIAEYPLATNPTRDYDNPPSVVICPFRHQDNEQARLLSHAVTEELVFQFSQRKEFFTHSPSIFANDRNRLELFLRMCRLFNIDYIVDGNINYAPAQSKIRIRLIQTTSGQILNASEFIIRHEQQEDDLIRGSLKITLQLLCNIISFEGSGLYTNQKPKGRHRQFLLGQRLAHTLDEESNQNAIRILQEILNEYGDHAPTLVELAHARHMAWRYDWGIEPESQLETAINDATRATSVDPENALAYSELGYAHVFANDPHSAQAAYDRAWEINPNDPWVLAGIADFNMHTHDHEKGVQLADQSLALNRTLHGDWRIWSLAEAYFFMEDYESVVNHVRLMNDWTEGSRIAAASLGLLGRTDEAQKYTQRIRQNQPDFSVDEWSRMLANSGGASEMVSNLSNGLLIAGLPR